MNETITISLEEYKEFLHISAKCDEYMLKAISLENSLNITKEMLAQTVYENYRLKERR